MSKDLYNIESEPREAAFYSGALDVLAMRVEKLFDYGDSVDADIFYVRDNDLSLLNDSVKTRLKYYMRGTASPDDLDDIDSLDFKLTRTETDVHSFICEYFRPYCSSDKLSDTVKELLDYLSSKLGEPLCIYQQTSMMDQPKDRPAIIDKNCEIFGSFYFYYSWDHFFISYKDYMVAMILGTDE